MDDLKDSGRSFSEGLPDTSDLYNDEGFVYEDMSFPQCSDSNSELNHAITDVSEAMSLTETNPYTDVERSFIEGLPDITEICNDDGEFRYGDLSFPQCSGNNSELNGLNHAITDVSEAMSLTETNPYTDVERSFIEGLPDTIEICSDDGEFRYGDLSFPQCSGNNSELYGGGSAVNDIPCELNGGDSAVNEPTALSETNSSSSTKTLDVVLDWVIDCYEDRGVLDQPLDNTPSLSGQNSKASANASLPVSSMQYDGCVNDSSNDPESPVCSMQSNGHVDQNDTPNAYESQGPLSQHGGGTSRDAEPSVFPRPVFNNTEMRQSLVLPPIRAEADFGVYFEGLMNNVHSMLAYAFARAEREDIVQIELHGEQMKLSASSDRKT